MQGYPSDETESQSYCTISGSVLIQYRRRHHHGDRRPRAVSVGEKNSEGHGTIHPCIHHPGAAVPSRFLFFPPKDYTRHLARHPENQWRHASAIDVSPSILRKNPVLEYSGRSRRGLRSPIDVDQLSRRKGSDTRRETVTIYRALMLAMTGCKIRETVRDGWGMLKASLRSRALRVTRCIAIPLLISSSLLWIRGSDRSCIITHTFPTYHYHLGIPPGLSSRLLQSRVIY
jgi:hypothetical protein